MVKNQDILLGGKLDEESSEWIREFVRLKHNEDWDKFREYLKTCEKLYLPQHEISKFINEFTENKYSYEQKYEFMNHLKKWDKFVNDVEITENKVVIDTIDGVVKAKILSEVLPQLKEIDPKIQTSERLGKCHQGTLNISSILENPHEVVTGYIYGPSDKAKYIHTWIECLIKEKECVIDYTMNAFMNKEGFYIIKNPEPLSRISSKNIKEDAKRYGGLLEKINLRQYLLYRDELISDLEKNGQFFDEDR